MTEMSDYMNYIALSRYARWVEGEGRRETWEESNQRIINFWNEHLDSNFPNMSSKDKKELKGLLG